MTFQDSIPKKIGKREVPTVFFSEDAFRDILLETHERIYTETGGVMLGKIYDDNWIVLEVVDPGPNSYFDRTLFEYDNEYQEHLANKIARRYSSLELLGLWHRHPDHLNDFSYTDFETFRKFVSFENRGILSGLVNFVPNFQFTLYYVNRNFTLYHEVEYQIEPTSYLENKYKCKKIDIEEILSRSMSQPNSDLNQVSREVKDNQKTIFLPNNQSVSDEDCKKNKYVSPLDKMISLLKRAFLFTGKEDNSKGNEITNTFFYKSLIDEIDSIPDYQCEEILVELDNLIASDPRNDVTWVKKSMIYKKLKIYNYAFGCIDKAIEINPDNFNYWNLKGEIYRAIKNYKDAIFCYNRSLQINPRNLEALMYKGFIFQDIGRYKEASNYLTEALKLDPSNIDLWKLTGSIYYLMREYDKAIVCFNEALKIDSDNVEALKYQSLISHELDKS